MAVQVETYEATECYDGIPEDRGAALELVEQMGLKGQEKFFEDISDPCPYRKMTAEEKKVYDVICPKYCKIEAYSDGPIPVRVMQIACHAKQFFGEIVVLHPENADVKDPVLIGVNGGQYNGERFILARWGETLLPFPELKAYSANIAKNKLLAKMKSLLAGAEAHLAALENMTPGEILDGDFNNPVLYK